MHFNHSHPRFVTWYQSVWFLNRSGSNYVALHAGDYKNQLTNREEINAMNNQMGIALPTEKLSRTNLTSWEYKMHQYLVGQGYWSYIKGAHENQPNSTHADYPALEQAVSRVLYCLAS